MDPKSLIYNKYAKIASELTSKYGYPVSVIHRNKKSIVPFLTAAEDMTVYIVAPRDKSEELIKTLGKDYPQFSREFELQITHPANEFIKLIKERPAMLREGLGGMGFITPFMFHTEIIGNYSRGFVAALKENFDPELNRQIYERIKRLAESRLETMRSMRYEIRKANEKEEKLVGKLEQKDLARQMQKMSEEIHANGSEVLIILDKSARPLGLPIKNILREAFKREVQIFFVNPEFAKRFKGDPARLKKLLDREHPQIGKAIAGKRVSIVDDQVYEGKSISQMKKLLMAYKPQNIHATVLSQWGAELSPSWRKQRKHHVEEYGKKKFVLERAELTPEDAKRLANMRKGLGFVAARVVKNIRRTK
ncbi:MAG: phosphoribosyltransferase [Candidatus Diapherotrites archaeon]|nr:phosphoribosyltransferase [Candidatus Diapherotrites archaeon]